MSKAYLLKASIRLDRLFEAYGQNPCLITSSGTRTFGDIEQILRTVIFNLEKAGVHKGQRVALFEANGEMHLYLFLASWVMDFLYIPLDFKAPLKTHLLRAPMDHLVTDAPINTTSGLSVSRPRNLLRSIPAKSPDARWPAIPFRHEASVIFTSGSTGKPKGVIHTVGNYIYSALGTNEFIGLAASDRWLLSLPLFHVGGALIWVRTLLSGSTCILPGSLQKIDDAILRYRPDVLSLVPAQLTRLLGKKEIVAILRQCKTIMLGGAPPPAWLIDQSLDLGLPIMPTYGCTESCAQVTGVARGSDRAAYHSAGVVVPHREIRIAQDGAIVLCGETIFPRYLHEKKSAGNRNFQTADQGCIDERGNLIVSGRKDGVFISGGENIHPFEIENALLAMDDIIIAIVVPAPHREFGMTPWAFVETKSPLNEKKIIDRLREVLPGYKIPKRIIRLLADDKKGKMKYSRAALTARAGVLALGKAGA